MQRQAQRPNRRRGLAGVLVVAALHFVLAAWWLAPAMDDQLVNAHEPTAHDAGEYWARGAAWGGGAAFDDAFFDARRTPGYPAFLAGCVRCFERPRLAARWIQLVAASALVIVSGAVALASGVGLAAALLAALLAAAWPPFVYFVPIQSEITIN